MLTSFYYYERKVKVHLLDVELWSPVHAILPTFRVNTSDLGFETESNGKGFRGEGRPDARRVRGSRREGQPVPGGERPRLMRPERYKEFSQDKVKYENLNFEGHPNLLHIESEGHYIKAWIGSRSVYASAHAPKEVPIPNQKIGGGPLQGGVIARWNKGNREVIQPTPMGFVLIGVSADVIAADLAEFRNKLILAGIGILAIGYVGGWWIARRALRPIASMSQAAVQISGGDLSQRIDETDTKNELSDLVNVLNTSFEKLEESFTQQRRFSADASHEMRTPLAVILAKTELALVRERPVEKYQETLQTCYDSASHMSTLVESLLELSKVDSGQFKVVPKLGQLSILVEDCVQLVSPLAEKKGIEIESDLIDVRCSFDEQRLRQVMINLLSNAIKYNKQDGYIRVGMQLDGENVLVKIKDSGPGLSDEDSACIFNRFYKVDNSRASEKGSTGLGLPISKAIVDAHCGSISVDSELGVGSEFSVSLPIKY